MVCVKDDRYLDLGPRLGLKSGTGRSPSIHCARSRGTPLPSAADQENRERVRQAVDIVDLVGSYLQLVRKGQVHVALCPWHEDTRPSLNIDPRRQTYHCYVCAKGGDIFSFVMEREGLTFPEAVRFLADRAGITLHHSYSGGGSADSRKKLQSILEFAAQEFHQQLLQSSEAEAARAYLAQRGISPASIQQFLVGYSPSGWTWFRDRALRNGFTEQELDHSGMLVRRTEADRTFDRFRGRLMFPIRDPQGRVIAFGGRVLPGASQEAAKYINSPETKLFTKNQQLYALDMARHHASTMGSILVMEGYTDVIMAHQHGVKNAVAVLGTALGARHLQLLQRYTDKVVLVLDGDEAGRRRANEVVELFMASPLDVRVCTLPDQLDPCDFLISAGGDALRLAVDNAEDALSHKLAQLTQNVDFVKDPHAANRALEEMLQLVTRIPADSHVDDGRFQLRARQTVGLLARTFQIPAEVIQSRISQYRKARKDSIETQDVSKMSIAAIDLDILGLLTRHPQLISQVVRAIEVENLESEVARQIFVLFANASDEHPEVEFGLVLASIEDPDLKTILVEIDTRAGKHPRLCQDPQSVLNELIECLQKRTWSRSVQLQLSEIESKGMNELEEIRAVEQIVAEQRSSQGIPPINSPMDG